MTEDVRVEANLPGTLAVFAHFLYWEQPNKKDFNFENECQGH